MSHATDIEPDVDEKYDYSRGSSSPTGEVDGENLRRRFTYEDGQRLKRKADWRLLPILISAYLIKNIDGNIVSYVKTMNSTSETNILKSLNMTANQYAYVSTCFTVTFIIFQVPSNIVIKWSTPRLHFFRIILLWSATCACTAACTNMAGLFACRAILGMAEAGLYPGILYQLTCWYRPDELAVRMAALGTLGQFSGILDALLTYGLAFIDGRRLAGWQWSFIICGLLGFLISIWIFLCLPDWPDSPPSRRQFLIPEEGAFMVARLPPTSPRSDDKMFDWTAIKKELRSPLLYGYSVLELALNSGLSGVSFWLPTIVAGFGLTSTTSSQLLAIPPAAVYIISSLSVSWLLDNETRVPRPMYMIISSVPLIGFFIGMIFCRSKGGLYALILLAYVFAAAWAAALMPMRAQSMKGSAAVAFGFAFQNACGQIPSLYTAQIFQTKYAPLYGVSYGVCIAFFGIGLLSVAFIWYFQFDVERENRRIARVRRQQGKNNQVAQEDIFI